MARWGETGLLNTRGELFVNDARHMPAELPELVGPPGFEALMTERYLAVQGRLVEAGMRLSQPATGRARRLGAVARQRRARCAWAARRWTRDSTDSWLAAARIVAARADEIAYVDLRYATGFAIGWRSGGEEVTRG